MPVGLIFNQPKAEEIGVKLDPNSSFEDLLKQCAVARDKGVTLTALAGTVPGNPGILAMSLASSTVYGSKPDWNADRLAGKTTFAGGEWLEAGG